MISTVDRARGRWREILPLLGIDTRFLTNRHGPCPLCGGRDRYRFDDKNGDGTYYCNRCGAGCGMILVRKKRGWDFRTAADEIDKIIGTDIDDRRDQPPPASKNDIGKRSAAINRALSDARAPGVVEQYLSRRGLSITSPVLRGDARAPYYVEEIGQDGQKQYRLIGRYPAVVAPIVGPDGAMQSAHRIYDAELDPRKKTLPPIDTIKGGAVRLFDVEDGVIGIAEGVETALAATQLFHIPTWAALTEGGVNAFVPPRGLTRLHIFADNDTNFVGQTAAFSLAKRLRKQDRDLVVEVHVPPIADTDWLDILINGGAQ